jgi:hypothetical protein
MSSLSNSALFHWPIFEFSLSGINRAPLESSKLTKKNNLQQKNKQAFF